MCYTWLEEQKKGEIMAVSKEEKRKMQNDLDALVREYNVAADKNNSFHENVRPLFVALGQGLVDCPKDPAMFVQWMKNSGISLDPDISSFEYSATMCNFLKCVAAVTDQVNARSTELLGLKVGDKNIVKYINEVKKSLNEIGSLMSEVREYSRQANVVALKSALMVIQINYCILAVVTVLPMWHMLKLWCKILNLGLPSNHKIAFANANRDKYGYSVLRMPWDDASKKSFISAYQYVGSLGRKAYDKDPNWYSNQNERIRTLKDSVKSISQLNREIDLNVTKIRDMFPSGMFSRGSEFMRSPIHGGKTAQIFSGLVAKRNEQHRQEQEQRLQRLDDSVQEGDGLLDRVWSLFFPPARNLGV